MFARIFKTSSKDELQPDDPLTPSQQLREESRRTRSMVTTRGRARELADSPSVNGDGDSMITDEGTPVPKRRGRPRKSLPLDDDEVAATPRPTRNSKKLSAQASEEEATPIQSPQVIEEIPNSAEESEDAQIIEADEEVIKTSKANGDVSTLSKITTTVTTPVAKKHKRFDSAEPESEPVTEEKSERVEVQEEEESSDDDAPEEVTTNEAAKSAKEKEKEATKAIEEYVQVWFCVNNLLIRIPGKKLPPRRSARRKPQILNVKQRSLTRSANWTLHPDKTICYLPLRNRRSRSHQPPKTEISTWMRNQIP